LKVRAVPSVENTSRFRHGHPRVFVISTTDHRSRATLRRKSWVGVSKGAAFSAELLKQLRSSVSRCGCRRRRRVHRSSIHRSPWARARARKARLRWTTGRVRDLAIAQGPEIKNPLQALAHSPLRRLWAGGMPQQVQYRHKRPNHHHLPTFHREVPIHAPPSGARRRPPWLRRALPQRRPLMVMLAVGGVPQNPINAVEQRRFASAVHAHQPAEAAA